MKKNTVSGEVAVMEVVDVGMEIMTAKKTPEMAEATAKKRKVSPREFKFSASGIRLKNRRSMDVRPESSVSQATSANSSSEDACGGPCSDRTLTSCCSSNDSSEHSKENKEDRDPEEENVDIATSKYNIESKQGRETTAASASSEVEAESSELESTSDPVQAKSSRLTMAAENMPSEAELEEFFAAAEKDLQKQFAEKYNYDIAKDEPLEGRYKWVQLKTN